MLFLLVRVQDESVRRAPVGISGRVHQSFVPVPWWYLQAQKRGGLLIQDDSLDDVDPLDAAFEGVNLNGSSDQNKVASGGHGQASANGRRQNPALAPAEEDFEERRLQELELENQRREQQRKDEAARREQERTKFANATSISSDQFFNRCVEVLFGSTTRFAGVFKPVSVVSAVVALGSALVAAVRTRPLQRRTGDVWIASPTPRRSPAMISLSAKPRTMAIPAAGTWVPSCNKKEGNSASRCPGGGTVLATSSGQ